MILQPKAAYKKDDPVLYSPEGFGVGVKIKAMVTSDENDGKYTKNEKTYTILIVDEDPPVVLKDGERVLESTLIHRRL